MSRTNPKVFTPDRQGLVTDDAASRARRVRTISRLLDNAIVVPGTSWRIGFDPIVGLIPGIGDFVGALLSGYIVVEAARAQIPTLTLARMLTNIGIDTLVGAVPAVGDLFDAAWKANTRNVELLERHLSRELPASGKRGVSAAMILAVIALIAILAAGLALGIFVARLLWRLGTG